ncbi:hypothetical protein [Stenotrophomonas sp. PFBMAA-4]|uniref:hypothetical protein n=1 Tax=Stenotrophomonas sp. PFBMAA-4 TaxID=3043301 RepID=UPI0024B4F9CD|nr:hypothetical protein [Stenotrophomonas sp. PFBMAA-4]MDI9274669.1 hypothetical protein [Stenotrophomonas sp. PFBMAA-4]
MAWIYWQLRLLVGTSVRYRMNHPRMAWIYWQLRLLVGADQRSAPTKAERRSNSSQETVEGGVPALDVDVD